ncbi:MAG TPA: hypothetical protein PK927_06060, partial [Smithellaceae bacterium]|nr:hypothetical protein [Smithellaceae bacterium]
MNLSEKWIEQNFNSLSLWGLQPLVPVDCDLNLDEKIYDALHEVVLFLKNLYRQRQTVKSGRILEFGRLLGEVRVHR